MASRNRLPQTERGDNCDQYPLPNIAEILDQLGRCVYYTTLDLVSKFHQIEMDPRDIKKTAFAVGGGHYEYVRMPFRLKNAHPHSNELWKM